MIPKTLMVMLASLLLSGCQSHQTLLHIATAYPAIGDARHLNKLMREDLESLKPEDKTVEFERDQLLARGKRIALYAGLLDIYLEHTLKRNNPPSLQFTQNSTNKLRQATDSLLVDWKSFNQLQRNEAKMTPDETISPPPHDSKSMPTQ